MMLFTKEKQRLLCRIKQPFHEIVAMQYNKTEYWDSTTNPMTSFSDVIRQFRAESSLEKEKGTWIRG